MLNTEIAIPFNAFAPDREPVEDIDVLTDEIDGTIVAVEPGRSAATMGDPPLRAGAGRVVVSVAGDGAGSSQSAEEMVDRLLEELAEFEGIAGGAHTSRHEHHDPADLEHWGQVDAARGRLATALDIVICTHYLGARQRTYVVTLEGPAQRLFALLSAAEAVPQAKRRALLTPAGAVTAEPAGSVLLVAAARHAHHLGGRAEVFPGQEWLAVERPVADVLDRTAIDEVRGTQGPFAPGAVLRAYGFVRPSYADGALVLTVGHDDPLVAHAMERGRRYCRPCCGEDRWTPRHSRGPAANSARSHGDLRPYRRPWRRVRCSFTCLVTSASTVLPEHTCWMLLRSVEVARLAVSVDDRPDIFPVNFVVDHGTVVIRTWVRVEVRRSDVRPFGRLRGGRLRRGGT